jgi:hypothetical protein
MNSLYKFRGLMLIALWQTAPPIAKTEDGKLQIGVGYGGSRIDEVFFTGGTDCEGNDYGPVVEHRKRHKPQSFGASLTGMLSKRLRMGAAVSAVSADTTSLSGAQFKAVAAVEWKYFGVGAGLSLAAPGTLPGVYMRAGPLAGVHLRADMPDLSIPVSTTGVGRAGIAFNQTERGIGAFLGVPVCYTTCSYGEGGIRGDVRVPVSQRFSVYFSGFRHSSDDQQHWGFATGGTVRP